TDPLLVSVRSGAKFSMPGMMDTVLNLGLNDDSVQGLASQTSNDRFAWDAYRRFVQMFGKIVLDIPGDRFEEKLDEAKERKGPDDRGEAALRRLPAERPGRGRRGGHPQHPPAGEAGGDRPGVLPSAPRWDGHLGRPLPRHVRHRVHHRTPQAVVPPDPGGEADLLRRVGHGP